ncbi:transposase [Mesorhizobium sp. M0933]
MQVRRLQTITGVNAIVASGIIAAVGDIRRFREPQKLVSYFGLNPRVRQSGLGCAIWPDQQTWAFPCPRHAGRGRLGGGEDARTAQGFLPTHPQQARPSGRSRGTRPQARGVDLASADKGAGLLLGSPGAGGGKAEAARSQGWRAGRARCWSPRFGLRLQREGVAKQRESRGRECRACVRANGSALAATRAEAAHGRHKGGTTIAAAWRYSHPLAPLFASWSSVPDKYSIRNVPARPLPRSAPDWRRARPSQGVAWKPRSRPCRHRTGQP